MTEKRLGRGTISLPGRPSLLGWGSTVGKKEGRGPLGAAFGLVQGDSRFGRKTWEQGESAFQASAVGQALEMAGLSPEQLDLLLAGDLNNQCIASSYAARGLGIPFFGLYGACSTMAEGLALGAMLAEGGFCRAVCAAASSHFCTAERQYRTPLEYGGQRTPTAQWTATAAGAAVLAPAGPGPYVTHLTTGRVRDLGGKDPNNMGAAMAPAAYDTIRTHLADTGRRPGDYDLILTGDLGALGKGLVEDLFRREGVALPHYEDCGLLLFDRGEQDVHCGASGAGCSAAVLAGYVLPGLRAGRWRRVLFCGTGALHSPTALGQGESIPGICHAVALSSEKEED